MDYKMLVLDLDGTLTNSKKEVTEPTRKALIEIQEDGKIVVGPEEFDHMRFDCELVEDNS